MAKQSVITLFAVLVYLALVVRRQPPGFVRFTYSLPCVLFLFRLPLLITRSLTIRGSLAFIIGWLSNAKILALTADRGPLSRPGLSYLQFLLLLLLPVYTIKHSAHAAEQAAHRQPRLPLRSATAVIKTICKGAFFAGMTTLLTRSEPLPSLVKHACYAIYIYLIVSLLLDPILTPTQALLDGCDGSDRPLRLQRSMEAPFLSQSVREFWGYRYNQVVSATLEDLVYLPLLQGQWVRSATGAPYPLGLCPGQNSTTSEPTPAPLKHRAPPGMRFGTARHLVALTTTFLVSGVMHELMIWYMCLDKLPRVGPMLTFFVVQPLLILIQDLTTPWLLSLSDALQTQSCRSPWQRTLVKGAFRAFRIATTLCMLLVAAELLFWDSFETGCQIATTGLNEVLTLVAFFKSST